MQKSLLLILAVFISGITTAQVKAPQPSPAASITQTIGLGEITVEYSRPSARERKVFGNLVPYDQIWRTGANAATVISFSKEMNFGGETVPAGKYALYSVPSKNAWEILLYSETGNWGVPQNLDESKVVVRCKVQPQNLSPAVETFKIGFDQLRNESANLELSWENTLISIPVTIDSNKDVIASIERTMAGPSANDYFQAASYYLQQNMDLKQALDWSKKAEQLRPEAFWMTKTQAEIYAAQGDFQNAIATANRSMEAARKAGNDTYVKSNQENIAKWQNRKK
ncbi:MAG: DUF2911 domain-containing protein [Weeksellaceae bacterium]|nr:DUF2911 domain-containing protein [Weeksellaceae bacterium]